MLLDIVEMLWKTDFKLLLYSHRILHFYEKKDLRGYKAIIKQLLVLYCLVKCIYFTILIQVLSILIFLKFDSNFSKANNALKRLKAINWVNSQ